MYYAYKTENMGPYQVDPRDHIGLAKKLAQQFRCRHLERTDLDQEALAALCAAARTFDPTKGIAFSTWAGKLIRAHLIGVVNLYNRIGHVGSRGRRCLTKPFKGHVHARGNIHPDVLKPLLRNRFWMAPSEWDCFVAADAALYDEKYLSQHVRPGDSPGQTVTLEDTLVDEQSVERIEQPLVDEGYQKLIDQFLEELPPRERDLAVRRVLSDLDDPPTLQQIGDEWGVSRERVRQIEERVRRVLGKKLGKELIG